MGPRSRRPKSGRCATWCPSATACATALASAHRREAGPRSDRFGRHRASPASERRARGKGSRLWPQPPALDTANPASKVRHLGHRLARAGGLRWCRHRAWGDGAWVARVRRGRSPHEAERPSRGLRRSITDPSRAQPRRTLRLGRAPASSTGSGVGADRAGALPHSRCPAGAAAHPPTAARRGQAVQRSDPRWPTSRPMPPSGQRAYFEHRNIPPRPPGYSVEMSPGTCAPRGRIATNSAPGSASSDPTHAASSSWPTSARSVA